jgi:rhamnosyltransferase
MSRVIAVIPTYQPDEHLITRLAALSGQVDRIVIVDDGSPSTDVLDRVAEAGFDVIRSRANRGIASALNVGCRMALEDGADLVLTLDQDSEIPADYVDACASIFGGAAAATRLGALSPGSINGAPSLPPRASPEGIGIVDVAIQSGLMVERSCLRASGLFDERLFIDGVDTEFCLRIGLLGYRIGVVPNTDLKHELGLKASLRPFGVQVKSRGRQVSYEYHGPYRRYFMSRNAVDIWLRYGRVKGRWVLSDIKHEYAPTVTTLVSGPHRMLQLLSTLVGVFDGLRRKRGPMSPWLRATTTKLSN